MSEQNREERNTAPEASAETYSLASILAEYKSEAFLRNERRLSRAELEKQADAIIAEMKRSVEAQLTEENEPKPKAAPAARSAEMKPAGEEARPKIIRLPVKSAEAEEDAPPIEAVEVEPTLPEVNAEAEEAAESEAREAERIAARERRAAEKAQRQAEQAAEREQRQAERIAEREQRRAEKAEKAAEKARQTEEKRLRRAEAQANRLEEQRKRQAAEEEERRRKPEISPEEAQQQYASGISLLQRRLAPAFAISALMAVITVLAGSELLPQALSRGSATAIVLLVMQTLVMALGMDLLAKGAITLVALRPGLETMVLAANLAALVDAALAITGKTPSGSIPYCATAAFATAFALWGNSLRRCAARDTIRAMRLASVPTVVTAEDDLTEGSVVLTKKLGTSKGFLRKCFQPDAAEKLCQTAAPWYLALIVILAVAAAYLSGTGEVIHCLACLSSAAVTFSAALVYARPFSKISKKLINNGAALAGWSGARDMLRADGMIIRDLDVFPENTIILNGMKVLGGRSVEKVVAYTGSVILATDSGLKRVFGELMRQYAAPLYHVEDFHCGTEGGVSAFVNSEQVLVGTSAYMNLMGVRVPSSMDVAGAVYTAIDHELSGIFIVHYTPVETVQNALYRLESGKLKPVFAIRDPNIRPSMLVQKFRLAEGSVVFPPVETRYELSVERESAKQPSALLSREGLWHYSEVARAGRRLVRTVRRALTMTAIGSVLGVFIGFISCAKGAFAAVAPGKLLMAMLLWAFAVLMVADSAEGD